MKQWLKLCLTGVTAALLLMSFAACGGGGEEDASYVPDSGEKASVTCPLDGERLDSPASVGDYVFIVSIENGPDSEPQTAIGEADLLIEVPVEAGITRFMAFFYHHMPDSIGPVRSARHYFYDVVNGYDAIMVHCGGSEQAYNVIENTPVKDIDEISLSGPFRRVGGRKAPHNLYTSYKDLRAAADKRGYGAVSLDDCPAFSFLTEAEAAELTFGGVSELSLPYRYKPVRYEWDESAETYQRYSDGHLHMDEGLDEAVTADNVAVLYVSSSVIDSEGRLDMDIDAGEGLLLQYGRAIPITWDQQNGRGFSFYDAEDGSAVKLLPGRTIIQVISPDRKAEYTLSGGGED
ncbi:MAG: DUF3048 domain-containing protein [Bacillota bacterium]|jgi:hypothetical protein